VSTCAFCPAIGDLQICGFPVQGFVPSTYGRLAVGDQVRRISDKAERPPATVVRLKARCNGVEIPWGSKAITPGTMLYAYASVTVILQKANGKEITREVYARSPVRVLRQMVCGALVCELHRCERGPGATCCADHWRSLSSS
jgi:hypothetical protein